MAKKTSRGRKQDGEHVLPADRSYEVRYRSKKRPASQNGQSSVLRRKRVPSRKKVERALGR